MLDESALSLHVLRSLSDGIVVLDLTGRILYANTSAEELLLARELVGRSVDDFLDETGRGHSAGFLAEAAEGRFLPDEVDTMLVRGDGRSHWVRLRQTPYVEDDRIAGVVLRLTDNDETKGLLEAVHTSHRALVRAERIGRSGSWTWDLATGDVSFSEGLEELYGDKTRDLLSQDRQQLVEMTHPDDQRRLMQVLDGLLTGGLPRVDVEVRHLGRHGWMWVRLRAVGVYDAEGRLKEASGTYQDITRARATEDRLQDLVTQTSLMQAVATAANTAATLDEILVQARDLVVLHDDWDRARAFVPAPDGDGLVPHVLNREATEAVEPDADEAEVSAIEATVAAESYRTGESVWDTERRLSLACPVRLGEEIVAVVVITSLPPLYRHDMIQSMVEDAALILARVAERERTERALSEARDRAVDASRHKSEFLATMSHEIRTPLNGIIGLNELLVGTDLSDRQQHFVTGIGVSSRTLLDLINDILDFSKIEAGRFEVEVIDLKVREVLAEVANLLAESARLREVELEVTCADDVPDVVVGDPTRLKQVLLNLGSNAIKFTAEGSVRIQVTRASEDPTLMRVEVHDTGIGISAEQQEWIFAPFSQADTSTTRHYGGSGLGLAICAEIVAALGGQIGVESTPGVGSRFWFTLPLGTSSSTTRAPGLRLRGHRVDPTPTPPGGIRASRGRVLVVEDNLINQVVARGFLEAQGFVVDTADDGRHALDHLARTSYDAVLMDVQMPRLDGYATTRVLRSQDARAADGRRLPIVAVTATAVAGEREKCLEAGMDDFMTKPLSAVALADVLARWTGADPVAVVHVGPVDDTGEHDVPVEVASPHLDLERLQELLELTPDDTAYLDRAIGRFLENGPEFGGLVAAAVASVDASALTAAAHAIKGSTSNLGLRVVSRIAHDLEDLGRTGTTVGAEPLLQRLEDALLEAATAITAYRDWYQARPGR